MRLGFVMLGFLAVAVRLLWELGGDLLREARAVDLQRAADDLAQSLL